MQDLVDKVLDLFDAMRENAFLVALAFACSVIVWAYATTPDTSALDRLAVEQRAAIFQRYHAKDHWDRMRAKARLEEIDRQIQAIKEEAGMGYMTNREFSENYPYPTH